MTAGRIACTLAVFICVMALFFFPALNGPYPAVHGPVTALLSVRAAARVRLIIRTGVRSARTWLAWTHIWFAAFSLVPDFFSELPSIDLPAGSASVLRC